ncbi:hypothetical protein JAAARDRAFT_56958 [Jaapia argillacea MUCL 33604]|uniref:Uncharacterized protein n=1 Tax=Jaapia argillacea MUCL 33604 TaxID=933084 RepID=A0A067PW90_9AGAM|nr:hypothetical protein JAAARDRAFT_56958 [Jaapia argillacea MUCL 33604]
MSYSARVNRSLEAEPAAPMPAQDVTSTLENFTTSIAASTAQICGQLDNGKRTVDTVNALIVVATFIAGVQTQIISLSYTADDTNLAKATNFIGFLGIILDILGAAGGVVHTIMLQGALQQLQRLLDNVKVIEDHLKWFQRLDEHETSPSLTHTALFSRVRDVQPNFTEDVDWSKPVIMAAVPTVFDPLSHLMRVRVIRFGLVPLAVTGVGFICLLLSVITLAAHTSSRSVYIGCTAVAVVITCLSLLPVYRSCFSSTEQNKISGLNSRLTELRREFDGFRRSRRSAYKDIVRDG